jgi:hypothetical protein
MAWSSIQDLSRAQTAGFRFHEISGMSRRASARHAAAQNAPRATRRRQHGRSDFDARSLRQPKARAMTERASGSTSADSRSPHGKRQPPTPKARAMTERQASDSTGADSRSPHGKRQPHAEGERYLSAKGRRQPLDGRPKAAGVWAGFSGPGRKAGAPGDLLAAFRRMPREISRAPAITPWVLTCTQSTQPWVLTCTQSTQPWVLT